MASCSYAVRAAAISLLILSSTAAHAADTTDTALRAAARFFEGFNWSAEARFRFDAIFADTTTGTSDRYRGRLSLRGGFTKRLNDRVLFGFRLSTGSAALPTSSYQSFDNIALGKLLALDHAYADVQPFPRAADATSLLEEAGRSLHLIVGKHATPFRSTELVWDRDVSVEGVSELLQVSRGPWTMRAMAGQYAMDDNTAPDDPYVLSQDLEIDYAPSATAVFSATAGLHHFIRPFSLDPTSQSWTNIKQADHASSPGFSVLDLSVGVVFQPGRHPIRINAGYIQNLSAARVLSLGTTEDKGWLIEATYGKTSAPGTWEVGGGFRRVEADATPGQFGSGEPATMSAGGTDVQGGSLRCAYACWKDVIWSASGYRSRPVSSRPFDPRMRVETTLLVRL